MNHPPPALKAQKTDSDARRWIMRHGFTWRLLLSDVSTLSISGASHGAGEDCLVAGDTRRRVTYFDLGFSGHAERIRLVQALETMRGRLTICYMMRGDMHKETVDHPRNLLRWHFYTSANQDW